MSEQISVEVDVRVGEYSPNNSLNSWVYVISKHLDLRTDIPKKCNYFGLRNKFLAGVYLVKKNNIHIEAVYFDEDDGPVKTVRYMDDKISIETGRIAKPTDDNVIKLSSHLDGDEE